MADRADAPELDRPVPPPGESIHLPDPAYTPVLVGFGLMVGLVGVVVSYVICAIGVLITLVAVARWVGQARREMAALPLEHEH